jgi:hypothetical protein
MASFEKTVGILEFFRAQGAGNVRLGAWDKSGKPGAQGDNGLIIPVSKDIEVLTADLRVSWFTPDDAPPFWLCHRPSSGFTAIGEALSI